MAIVASYDVVDKLLKPLGIDTKHLIRCHIYFGPDDMVRVHVEYALEEPTQDALTEWKRYALAELEDTPEQVFDDIIRIFNKEN